MKEEDTNMEIKRPAIAGTLESSDCQVMVEAGEGKIDLSLDSAVSIICLISGLILGVIKL